MTHPDFPSSQRRQPSSTRNGKATPVAVDVTILGGGPAGSAAALTLRRHGLRVALVERRHYGGSRPGETLAPQARPLLVQLGAWQAFLGQRHSRTFATRSAWGGPILHETDFVFNPHGNGWHLDRARFDALLARRAAAARTDVRLGQRIASAEPASNGEWALTLVGPTGPRVIRSRWVVDATGRSAVFAQRQGARRETHDALVGIVAFASRANGGASNDSSTLVEAVDDGWWYSALVPGSRLSVAYMTDADLYRNAPHLGRRAWAEALKRTTHTRRRLSGFRLEADPRPWPAATYLRFPLAGRNWVCVGEAASAFDPLCSLGLCHALESGLRSGRAIASALSGHDEAVAEYARWIRQRFEDYLAARARFYQAETRWPDSPFWARRHSRFESFEPPVVSR